MFLDETKYQSAELYEVKTRKIILLSNTIATTSNAIYVALSKDYKKLDAGGMLVTLYRLISDKKFISKVKEEFINTKLDEDLQTELDERQDFGRDSLKVETYTILFANNQYGTWGL